MSNFQSILMIVAGLGMLIAAISLISWRKGEPVKAFVIYFAVFLSGLLILTYFIIALALIGFGLIGFF